MHTTREKPALRNVFCFGFSKRDIVNLQRWQYILLLIFLSVALFLVSSRAGLIIWGMIIIYFFINNLAGRYNFNETILSFLPFVLLAGVFVFLSINSNRFRVVADEISDIKNSDQKGKCSGSSEIRVVMWGRALEIIKENPLLGIGTGDVKDELQRNAEIEGYSIVKDWDFWFNYLVASIIYTAFFCVTQTCCTGLLSSLTALFLPAFISL